MLARSSRRTTTLVVGMPARKDGPSAKDLTRYMPVHFNTMQACAIVASLTRLLIANACCIEGC